MGWVEGMEVSWSAPFVLRGTGTDSEQTAIIADSLGGDLAFALGLSVFAPLPYRPQWPVKLHSFINTGKVVGWHGGECAQAGRICYSC